MSMSRKQKRHWKRLRKLSEPAQLVRSARLPPLIIDTEVEQPIVGFAAESFRGPGSVSIIQRGFFTSDDGPLMYTYLDGLFSGNVAKAMTSHGLALENIESCLLNVTDRTKVRLWINFPHVVAIVSKKLDAIRAGAPVHLDDIADVRTAELRGVEPPTRGAIAYTFLHRWRRGLYFDFTVNDPARGDPNSGIDNLPKLLGSLHAALILRDRIRFDEQLLSKLFAAGWFPFVRLPNDLVAAMYREVENGWDLRDLESTIVRTLGPLVPQVVESWRGRDVFAPHIDVLAEAARLFGKGEYRAASGLLIPKVEGVLRTMNLGRGRLNAPELRANLVERVRAEVSGYTAYLPEAFAQYLEAHYYAQFDLDAGVVPPSRHAFLHGVGPDAEMSKPEFALKLFLTLDQIFFCVGAKVSRPASPKLIEARP